MSNIKMIVRLCCITHQPYQESEVYRHAKKMFGHREAMKLTYEAELPKDDEPCMISLSTPFQTSSDTG